MLSEDYEFTALVGHAGFCPTPQPQFYRAFELESPKAEYTQKSEVFSFAVLVYFVLENSLPWAQREYELAMVRPPLHN
jgi:hypothetical protein